jgi:hypothetical protein
MSRRVRAALVSFTLGEIVVFTAFVAVLSAGLTTFWLGVVAR